VDPDARDLVMRGWALYQRPLSEGNRREALQAFERAQAIDPNSIDAKIGIAAVLAVNLANGTTETPKEDEARAEKLLADALQRDPNRAQLHVTIALLRRLQNRLAESRIEWERAIALDPNHAAAYGQLGVTLIYLGDPTPAGDQFDRAPAGPLGLHQQSGLPRARREDRRCRPAPRRDAGGVARSIQAYSVRTVRRSRSIWRSLVRISSKISVGRTPKV